MVPVAGNQSNEMVLNRDGLVSGNSIGPVESKDLAWFFAGWLTTGVGDIGGRYLPSDRNFDGESNLADRAIPHRAAPTASAAVIRFHVVRGRIPSTVLRQHGHTDL